MNTITILGRLTEAPEMKVSQDGKQFANFTLADNRGKEASFFRCTAFGKTAELIGKAEKAHRLLVSGYMQEEKWTDQQTQQERRGWKTIVNEMSYIEAAPQSTQAPAQQQAQYNQPAYPAAGASPAGYGAPPAHGGYGAPPVPGYGAPSTPTATPPLTQTDPFGNMYQLVNNQWVPVQQNRPAAPAPGPTAATAAGWGAPPVPGYGAGAPPAGGGPATPF